jgi:hypothetical protein
MANDDAFNRRLTAAAGILLTVFFVVALLLPGTPPKADDSVQEITKFLVDKRGSLLAGDVFLGLGGLAFLVFAGGLRRYLAAASQDAGGLAAVAFGGAVAGIALLLCGAAVTNGIVFEAASAGGDLVRAFFDTVTAFFAISGFAFFVFVGAASWAAARAGAFPASVVWVGVLAAVLQVLGGITLFAKSGFFAGGGGITFLAPIVSTLWILAVSVVLYRGAPAPASSSS